jgi:GxxExxY protein
MDFAEFVDEEMEPDPELNRITNAVIGAAIEVHRVLGPGFLESVYQKALERELELRGVQFIPQQRIAVSYKGTEVGEGWLDFLIEHKVIVEIKAVDTLAPIHKAQAISYLRTTRHKLALLINFNAKMLKDGIKRIAL